MRNAIKSILGLLGITVVSLVATPGCFVDPLNDCFYNLGLACFWEHQGGSGGTGGSGGSGGAPPECVPSTATGLLSDDCGKFVSPDGDDTAGDGSKAKPYATIS